MQKSGAAHLSPRFPLSALCFSLRVCASFRARIFHPTNPFCIAESSHLFSSFKAHTQLKTHARAPPPAHAMSQCRRPFLVPLLVLLLFPSSHFLLGAAHSRSNPSAGGLFRLQHKFRKTPRAAGSSSLSSPGPGSFAHLARLRAHDRRRHARFLASAGVFQLGGIADPNVAGLYFTEVELGTPPVKYYVQIDTGSDLLWVNCKSCSGCPTSSELGVHLALYDPGSSSTSSNILCGDEFCAIAVSTAEGCQTGDACGYRLGYGDGSTSQGYFVRDVMQLDLAARNNSFQTANSTVVFGCGTSQGGGLGQSDQALDGIMGFGQSNLSIISQLANKKQVPNVFAHCLEGEGDGGGILVIGDVQAKGVVYTALIPDQPHYNVDLKTISVNGISIPVDSSSSGGGGTIIDSGTTLSYFSERVYQQLLAAVLAGLRTSDLFTWEGMTCTSFVGSVNDAFPTVTFTFEGDGATIVVKPSEYLVEIGDSPGNGWCVGFQTPQTSSVNLNIIGDLVLKDRLFIYDLEQQRIGWVDYDCSSNVMVSSSNGQLSVSATAIPSSNLNSSSATISYAWILQLLCLLATLLLLYNS